jgi:chemotaxis protein histidine kinase CheA
VVREVEEAVSSIIELFTQRVQVIVFKPLREYTRGLRGIYAATVLGDNATGATEGILDSVL